jgi:hypothetical protein
MAAQSLTSYAAGLGRPGTAIRFVTHEVPLDAMPQMSAKRAEVPTQFEAFELADAVAASLRQRGPDPA